MNGRTELLWTVDAPVIERPPDPPIACHGVLLSYPPQPGAGVRLRGLDPSTVPGAVTYPNGTIATPTLRLTGTYSDGWLTLVEPPVAVSPRPDPWAGSPKTTACPDPSCAPISTRKLLETQQRLRDDAELASRGIEILGSGPERNVVSLLVVAATPEQIEFVRERYGSHVEVTSWLQPAR